MTHSADIRLTLNTDEDFNLAHTMRLLLMGRTDPCMHLETQSVALALHTPDGTATLVAAGGKGLVVVDLWGRGAQWLEPRVGRMLGLCDDPSGFHPDLPLRDIWVRFRGMRLPHLPHIFPRLVQVILQQKVATLEAFNAWRRLCRSWGTLAPGPLNLHVPPTAELIAARGPVALQQFGLTVQQAQTIVRAAQRADRLELAAGEEPELLEQILLQLRGIGNWTTQYLLGSALGESDAVLLGDYDLPNTAAWVLTGRARGNDEQMVKLLDRYAGHRFRVIRLLWASGKNAPRRGHKHPLRYRA